MNKLKLLLNFKRFLRANILLCLVSCHAPAAPSTQNFTTASQKKASNAKKNPKKASNTRKLTNRQYKPTDPKEILLDFFDSSKALSGSFIHVISKEKIESATAQPEISQTGQDSSGFFKLDLGKPVRFKWKYVYPTVKQLIKDDKHILYKEGQFKKTAQDGISVENTNNKKPYIIFQSLPITFLFDVPVQTWIQEIDIGSCVENKDYISMVLSYKTLKRKGILKHMQFEQLQLVFSKSPVCLLQWKFVDPDGLYNQITLLNIKFNQALTSENFKID